jgi:hypothetical protein
VVDVPIMVFPAVLLAWWKSRVGAVLVGLIVLLHLGTLIVLGWPKVGLAIGHMLPSFLLFLTCAALLIFVAFFDMQHSKIAR